MTIIDAHVHVWKNDPKYPWAPETKSPPKEDATPEMLLKLMQAAGVSRTVLIQVIYYRWDNSYCADVLTAHPDKFQAVGRVDPQSPHAPDYLSYWTRERGFRGVRLSPAAGPEGDWFTGSLMPPLWQRTTELGVPMTILAPVTRMPDLAKLVDKFPDLAVVVDHMADCPIDRPDLLQSLLALARYEKVFVKISHMWSLSKQPYPYRDTHDQVKKLYDAFGPQRLIWGTDWPLVEQHCGYAKALTLVRDELDFLTDEDQEWVLGKTAQRVWRPEVAAEL
ncbi:MAG: amidohydrolase family protein [Planctomycetes bacterium]|nr:amidohydrolase family protein [Planctomycetota bacterium]